MKYFIIIVSFLIGCTNQADKKTTDLPDRYYTVSNGVGDDISPSCSAWMTYVWYYEKGRPPKIVRTYVDNMCSISDSIINKRLDEANALADMMNKHLKNENIQP